MHPTNAELLDYMFGQPSTELLERMEEHLDDCADCALTVARLVRAVMGAPEPDAVNDYPCIRDSAPQRDS